VPGEGKINRNHRGTDRDSPDDDIFGSLVHISSSARHMLHGGAPNAGDFFGTARPLQVASGPHRIYS
jgi:hypothetical protein